ncbi:MAG: hypothetical protein QOE20_4908 [Mycobacterium sp.]|nr:hypothetical protein [Mycobacterium sp.]
MNESDGSSIRATYCPVCFCNTGEHIMPTHTDKRGRECAGSGKRGVFSSQVGRVKKRQKAEEDKKRDVASRSDSVRGIRGGLPGQGKRG